MYRNNIQKEKGSVLYLAIVITAILLGVLFGVGSLFVGEVQILRGIGYSVVALYAAEAGMEKILYDDSIGIDIVDSCQDSGDCTGLLSNGATYDVVVDGSCGGFFYCAESTGTFKKASRKAMIER